MIGNLAHWRSPTQLSFKDTPEDPETLKQHIRDVLENFMDKCQVSFKALEYDIELHDACWAEVTRRGSLVESDNTKRILGRFIPMGVIIASASYRHLPHQPTKVFIALYTALLVYIDGIFQYNTNDIKCFNERFVRREPQGDVLLDFLAQLFMEFDHHFHPFASKVMLTASMDFMTAQLLESTTEEMQLSSDASLFANYARNLSGVSAFYGLAVFPRELPVQDYIQALPDVIMYCNHVNDIFSFYKEEITGEQVNHISNMAKLGKIPKTEALQRLAEETADACLRGWEILKDRPEAYTAFKAFNQGHIEFQACCPQYKLDELFDYTVPSIIV
ncbi:terpenoid synthase [Pluteus cervinus]|uniref:Terpenoid synthase n=1 Tax=Pluteus cervinus TaxID=181527 RepID=A0ACD3AL46_9AGAR|nr:terpenoid synthase [Pluteus cervinus]